MHVPVPSYNPSQQSPSRQRALCVYECEERLKSGSGVGEAENARFYYYQLTLDRVFVIEFHVQCSVRKKNHVIFLFFYDTERTSQKGRTRFVVRGLLSKIFLTLTGALQRLSTLSASLPFEKRGQKKKQKIPTLEDAFQQAVDERANELAANRLKPDRVQPGMVNDRLLPTETRKRMS